MQKYKVFLNEKRILFTSSGKMALSEAMQDNPGFGDVKAWLDHFEQSNGKELVIESTNPLEKLNEFSRSLIKINAAGGVVRKDERILFIFRNDKWDLPKGKIENHEKEQQAAIREVQEECGIEGLSVVKELPGTYHLYRSPYKKTLGQWVLKKTFWFEMSYSGANNGMPQKEEGISEVRWFKVSELGEILKNTYENLKGLIQIYA